MIQLPNGRSVEFIAASGALAFDGRGWPWEWPVRWAGMLDPHVFTVTIKTLTRHPRRGNLRWWKPWGCVRLLSHQSAVNAVGLTNPGIEAWLRRSWPVIVRNGYRVIVSIMPHTPVEAQEMVQMLNALDLVAVEINASCPNTGDDLEANTDAIVATCTAAARVSRHPLIVKVGMTNHYCALAQRLIGVVAAIHAINTIPWHVLYRDRPSPLAHVGGGGISGARIHPYAVTVVRELVRQETHPIIGGGGIMTIDDVARFAEAGAHAFSIGTLFLRTPWAPTRLVQTWRSTAREKGVVIA